jgi:hypothetical protein
VRASNQQRPAKSGCRITHLLEEGFKKNQRVSNFVKNTEWGGEDGSATPQDVPNSAGRQRVKGLY